MTDHAGGFSLPIVMTAQRLCLDCKSKLPIPPAVALIASMAPCASISDFSMFGILAIKARRDSRKRHPPGRSFLFAVHQIELFIHQLSLKLDMKALSKSK